MESHIRCIHTIAVNNFRFIFDITLESPEIRKINMHYALLVGRVPFTVSNNFLCAHSVHNTIANKFSYYKSFLNSKFQDQNNRIVHAINISFVNGPLSIVYFWALARFDHIFG